MQHTEQQQKILIVDDSLDHQVIIQKMLEAMPFQLSFASDGKQAVERVEKESFDLIIMDIEMPNRNGLTTLINMGVKRIHHDGSGLNIPVVVATGLHGEEVRQIILGQNINVFLRKPYKSNELLETVKNLIG